MSFPQACAPRYVYFSKSVNRKDPVGTCWVSRMAFSDFAEYAPCRTSKYCPRHADDDGHDDDRDGPAGRSGTGRAPGCSCHRGASSGTRRDTRPRCCTAYLGSARRGGFIAEGQPGGPDRASPPPRRTVRAGGLGLIRAASRPRATAPVRIAAHKASKRGGKWMLLFGFLVNGRTGQCGAVRAGRMRGV